MEIFIDVLVAWDPVTQTSKKEKGILGPVEAWARTDEEQCRKTLHAHFLFWITGMNRCRRDFMYGSDDEKKQAKKAFAKYADKVMKASYPDFKINLPCCGEGCEAKLPREVVSEVDLQTLRDARHQDECLKIGGKILKCKECSEPQLFTTQEIVMLSLDYWSRANDDVSHGSLTRDNIEPSWLDVATYTSPFDDLPLPDGCGWLKDEEVRETLLHLRFDEHDPRHRKGCFKKGCECRFILPQTAQEETEICVDTEMKLFADWLRIEGGSVRSDQSPYMVLPKRGIGS
ncbi:hypothetical protein THAOC_29743, partial [Thalassiosira oceanica]